MEAFTHLSVMFSIILGLGLTELLQGYGRLLQRRARVKWYWPPIAFAVLMLAVFAQTWWSLFGFRSYVGWTFAGFSIVLLQTVVLYMVAAILAPEISETGAIDMREQYFANARPLFVTIMLSVIVSLSKDLVMNGRLPDTPNVIFHIAFFSIAVAATATRRESAHKMLIPLALALFVGYVVLLFSRLH